MSEALGTPDADQQASVSAFLAHCLNHPDVNVQAAAVDVLAHFWQAEALLRLLPATTSDPLRARLAELEVTGIGGEADRDLASLEGFWRQG